MTKAKAKDTDADKAGKNKGKKAEPKTPAQEMWELGLCLGVAVLLAILIKWFLIEVFVIPSGSMEPTLHGRPDGGDRVLCTKINYWWRRMRDETPGPRRWEIFVFKYPFAQAQDYNPGLDHSIYKGQNFIKRCVGLPGEVLAIARGDIYTHSTHAVSGWTLQRKSDAVQRAIWIPVYAESFDDLAPEELQQFWTLSGATQADTLQQTDPGVMRLQTQEAVHLAYRPRLPTGILHQQPRTLKGIPDRYVVRQPVDFVCPSCHGRFRKTIWDQKIAGRCPHCGQYVLESSVVVYGRRSDLPDVGDYREAGLAVEGGETVRQGEHGKWRTIDYHLVSDLRLIARVRFEDGTDPELVLEIRDEGQLLQAVLNPGTGRATLRQNGGQPLAQASVDLALGTWHEIEFYRVDGEARLFVDRSAKPVLRVPFAGRKPPAWSIIRASGIMLSLAHGTMDMDRLQIDRDIYYYSGHEQTDKNPSYHSYPEELVSRQGVLQKHGYTAMGDNCPSSNDSRCWGPVPRDNLRGPAILVWWPLHRVHWIATPDK